MLTVLVGSVIFLLSWLSEWDWIPIIYHIYRHIVGICTGLAAANGMFGFPMAFPPLFALPTTGLPSLTATTTTTTTSQAKISSPKSSISTNSSTKTSTVTKPSVTPVKQPQHSPKHKPPSRTSSVESLHAKLPSSEHMEGLPKSHTNYDIDSRVRRSSHSSTTSIHDIEHRVRKSSHSEVHPGYNHHPGLGGEALRGSDGLHGSDTLRGSESIHRNESEVLRSPTHSKHDPLSIGALLSKGTHDIHSSIDTHRDTAAYALGALKNLAENAEAQQKSEVCNNMPQDLSVSNLVRKTTDKEADSKRNGHLTGMPTSVIVKPDPPENHLKDVHHRDSYHRVDQQKESQHRANHQRENEHRENEHWGNQYRENEHRGNQNRDQHRASHPTECNREQRDQHVSHREKLISHRDQTVSHLDQQINQLCEADTENQPNRVPKLHLGQLKAAKQVSLFSITSFYLLIRQCT